ncbi:MAG: hypothetical protein ACJ71Z_11160 [Aeromicrobium sp.]
MSTDRADSRPKHPRPSVVTLSCVFVAVTAFLTLTEVISALMDWGTVDMQAALRPALRQLGIAGLHLSMTETLRLLRWFTLAMVPFAVSAMVFAVYALRGDRTGRIMTSVLAVAAGILSLPIGVFGILQASMLFLSAGGLWTSDAGRWYRGEPPPLAPMPAAEPVHEAAAPELEAPAPVRPPVRPTSVVTAALLTILGSTAAAAFAGLYLVVYLFARDAYIEAVQTGPFKDLVSASEIGVMMRVTLWVSIAIVPLALAGLLGGAGLLARRPIGRHATLAWAWCTAALGVVMFPLGIVALAAAGAVIVLLRRDDARAWTSLR